MSYSAWVRTPVVCPERECAAQLNDVAWFGWGGLIAADFSSGPVYSLGDGLLWHASPDGTVPAFTVFDHGGGNVGDPRYGHVDVFSEQAGPTSCPTCTVGLLGTVTEIRRHRIAGVRVVRGGEWHPNTIARAYYTGDGTEEDLEMEWYITQPLRTV